MLRRPAILASLFVAGTALLAASLSSTAQSQVQWTTLFDGSDLDNFHIVGDANWRIVDGIAQADMGGGHLMTNESYDDFVLRAEFWVDEPANSGIFIRCADPAMPGAASSSTAVPAAIRFHDLVSRVRRCAFIRPATPRIPVATMPHRDHGLWSGRPVPNRLRQWLFPAGPAAVAGTPVAAVHQIQDDHAGP